MKIVRYFGVGWMGKVPTQYDDDDDAKLNNLTQG